MMKFLFIVTFFTINICASPNNSYDSISLSPILKNNTSSYIIITRSNSLHQSPKSQRNQSILLQETIKETIKSQYEYSPIKDWSLYNGHENVNNASLVNSELIKSEYEELPLKISNIKFKKFDVLNIDNFNNEEYLNVNNASLVNSELIKSEYEELPLKISNIKFKKFDVLNKSSENILEEFTPTKTFNEIILQPNKENNNIFSQKTTNAVLISAVLLHPSIINYFQSNINQKSAGEYIDFNYCWAKILYGESQLKQKEKFKSHFIAKFFNISLNNEDNVITNLGIIYNKNYITSEYNIKYILISKIVNGNVIINYNNIDLLYDLNINFFKEIKQLPKLNGIVILNTVGFNRFLPTKHFNINVGLNLTSNILHAKYDDLIFRNYEIYLKPNVSFFTNIITKNSIITPIINYSFHIPYNLISKKKLFTNTAYFKKNLHQINIELNIKPTKYNNILSFGIESRFNKHYQQQSIYCKLNVKF